ncbi:MAG TPA: anti-sigma factor [Casimicrobiaceae bacterium]
MGILFSCKDASRALSQMQDREVALIVILRLRLHLLVCVACQRFARQLRFLRAAMRRYSS